MEGHIISLQKSVRPGCKRLNWNSLGIQEYITKNEVVISQLCCLVTTYLISGYCMHIM